MDDPIKIQAVEPDGDDGLIVHFSDGTTAGYVVEELLDLRPQREPTESFCKIARWIRAVPQMRQDEPPPSREPTPPRNHHARHRPGT